MVCHRLERGASGTIRSLCKRHAGVAAWCACEFPWVYFLLYHTISTNNYRSNAVLPFLIGLFFPGLRDLRVTYLIQAVKGRVVTQSYHLGQETVCFFTGQITPSHAQN